jgi:hypothetical protein
MSTSRWRARRFEQQHLLHKRGKTLGALRLAAKHPVPTYRNQLTLKLPNQPVGASPPIALRRLLVSPARQGTPNRPAQRAHLKPQFECEPAFPRRRMTRGFRLLDPSTKKPRSAPHRPGLGPQGCATIPMRSAGGIGIIPIRATADGKLAAPRSGALRPDFTQPR